MATAAAAPVAQAQLAETAETWVERGRAWVRKARLESDPGFYLNVEACAQMALTLQALHPAALELPGQALMNSHEFAAARALAEAILSREPARASAYGLLVVRRSSAVSSARQRQRRSVSSACVAGLRSNIYLDDARGWALYRLGRYEEALLAIQRALRLNTPDARLWFHAGAIAIARGDSKVGVQRLQHALALNPAFDVNAAAEARTLLAAAEQRQLVARP